MSRDLIETLLRAIFSALAEGPESHIYVHCAAGQNRSPTTVWLAMVAAGMDPVVAAERIGDASFDANPGYDRLIPEPDDIIPWIRQLGSELPIPRDFLAEL